MMVLQADSTVFDAIARYTCLALSEAEICLPGDVLSRIEAAAASETNPVARGELGNILANVARARELSVPICQDTGVPVIYLTIPPSLPFTRQVYDAVRAGVREATSTIPLRPNVVTPLDRNNSGDNTGEGMPAIHARPGDRLTITVLPKGAGAENVSRVKSNNWDNPSCPLKELSRSTSLPRGV